MLPALVIRGRYANQTFIPEESLLVTEGPAELIVYPAETALRTLRHADHSLAFNTSMSITGCRCFKPLPSAPTVTSCRLFPSVP